MIDYSRAFYIRPVIAIKMKGLPLILLCLLSLSGLAQPTWLLSKPYAAKFYYCDSLFNFSESNHGNEIISKIENEIKWAATNGDQELCAELKLIRNKIIHGAHANNNWTIENELLNLANECASKKMFFVEADVLQTLGFYYWNYPNGHMQSLAFEKYLTAWNIYTNFPQSLFPQKRKYIAMLGTTYYAYEDYDNALKYLYLALATKPMPNDDQLNSINTTLGLCYRKMWKYDSSDKYFQKVYSGNNAEWKNIAGGNIGINYFYENRFDEAIPLLENDISVSIATNNNIRNAANSLYVLSMIYYARGEFDKSEKLLQKGLDICRYRKFWPDYSIAEHIYTQLYKVNSAKNNFHLAALYADSAFNAKDSAHARFNSLKLSKAQEKVDFAQHKLETEKLIYQKEKYEFVQYALLAGIILLLIIGILFINRQKLLRNKLETDKKNAELGLEAATIKLDKFLQNIHEKNEIIDHFTLELERLNAGKVEHVDNELRSRLEQATILTDDQWEDFRVTFEQVHKGFFGGLKKKFPDLSQAEIRFLTLTKMKLTSKEMGAMLGISANAIRMTRHRLRKKLDLDKDDMIDELVESL